jgi:cyanate permease
MRQGPLAGRYPAVAAMVTLALIPYLALSAALDPLVPIISEQLHMTTQAMSLSSGLGNAAYAVGTVLAVQFAQHLPQRRMLLVTRLRSLWGRCSQRRRQTRAPTSADTFCRVWPPACC